VNARTARRSYRRENIGQISPEGAINLQKHMDRSGNQMNHKPHDAICKNGRIRRSASSADGSNTIPRTQPHPLEKQGGKKIAARTIRSGQKHLPDRAGEKDTADARPIIRIRSEQPGIVGGGTSHPCLFGFSSPDGAAASADFIEMLFQEGTCISKPQSHPALSSQWDPG